MLPLCRTLHRREDMKNSPKEGTQYLWFLALQPSGDSFYKEKTQTKRGEDRERGNCRLPTIPLSPQQHFLILKTGMMKHTETPPFHICMTTNKKPSLHQALKHNSVLYDVDFIDFLSSKRVSRILKYGQFTVPAAFCWDQDSVTVRKGGTIITAVC